MRSLSFFLIVLFSTPTIAQSNSFLRSQFLNPFIETDENNIPKSPSTFYFPGIFFPKYLVSSKFKDSTSVLIGTIWSSTGQNQSLQDSVYLYSTRIENTIDSLYLKDVSRQLYAFKEPLLFNEITNKEIYRLTILRTFHNPVVIRIEKSENAIWIYAKQGSAASGYHVGKVKKRKQKKVSAEDWITLSELLMELDLWNSYQTGSIPSTDGSDWILEGSTPGYYVVYSRKSPNEQAEFYKLCKFLIELSELKIKDENLY